MATLQCTTVKEVSDDVFVRSEDVDALTHYLYRFTFTLKASQDMITIPATGTPAYNPGTGEYTYNIGTPGVSSVVNLNDNITKIEWSLNPNANIPNFTVNGISADADTTLSTNTTFTTVGGTDTYYSVFNHMVENSQIAYFFKQSSYGTYGGYVSGGHTTNASVISLLNTALNDDKTLIQSQIEDALRIYFSGQEATVPDTLNGLVTNGVIANLTFPLRIKGNVARSADQTLTPYVIPIQIKFQFVELDA